MNALKEALERKKRGYKREEEEDEYEMPRKKAVMEHKRLVKVLESKRGLKREAKEQREELKEKIEK